MCEEFLARCSASGIFLRVTHTLRTMDEQLHLYAKGRALREGVWVLVDPRAVVTKAKPGQSAHNFGLAFDIAFNGADPYPDERDPRWELIGLIGAEVGLDWGGPLGADDRFAWDRPHFQRLNWKSFRSSSTTTRTG